MSEHEDEVEIADTPMTTADDVSDTSGDDKPSGAPTLAELAEQRVLDSLAAAVDVYQSAVSYCCGGSLPIAMTSITNPHNTASVDSDTTKAQDTICFRWDTADDYGSSRKVEFPLAQSADQTKAQALFEELLKSCVPATFSHKNEDVLDETYRKAGKLDRDQFSSDFHPHDYGIIDAISQVLLPQINGTFLKERHEHRGVLAELYKINIYSGPSGKFKAHVDTPRGPTQFGSLVVCLPHPHEGGQLRVSHEGHSTFFDWSNTDNQDIQWAAFYSDCEHEVFEVKTGHRITLTYNLYVTEKVGGVLQRNPTADPMLFPLYEGAKQIIMQPNFMAEGGVLGFYCAYKYAHHTSRAHALLPWALKGIDVAIFSVFRSLGLDVTVRPVMGPNWHLENLMESREEDFYEDHGSDCPYDPPKVSYVGTDFHKLALNPDGVNKETDFSEYHVRRMWPYEEWNNIIWLNKALKVQEEMAIIDISIGNEADLVWTYSHAAILVTVPARGARNS